MAAPKYNDRCLAIGFTGSGKSELLNIMFSALRCQKLLLDTKHEFAIEGVEPVSHVADLDWSQPVLLYRDRTNEAAEFEELFAACFRRRQLVVCAHELADVCEYQPGRTPASFNRYVSKGRAMGLGLLAGAQRPVQMPVRGYSEAQHIYIFCRAVPVDQDLKRLAEEVRKRPDELARIIMAVRAQLGEYGYLHFDRATGELVAMPPLPEHLRRGVTVQRTIDH